MRLVWTTHANDEACCLVSVKHALMRGVSPSLCFVGASSITDEGRKAFEALGVKVVRSLYTRRDLFTDLVARLRLVSGQGGDWVLSLDSDTIIEDFGPFQNAMTGGTAAAAPVSSREGSFLGCATLFHVDSTKTALRELLERNPCQFPSSGIPDDAATRRLFVEVFGKDAVALLPASLVGWHRFSEKGFEDLQGAVVCNFGQRAEARRLAKGRPVRHVIHGAMEDYLNANHLHLQTDCNYETVSHGDDF